MFVYTDWKSSQKKYIIGGMKKLSLMYIFIGCFTILSFIFLSHYTIVGQAVYGDGKYYWSYVRSVWKDHDLDLRDELNRVYSPKTNNQLKEGFIDKKPVFNWFPIGPSIAWLPAFIVADSIASVIHYIVPSFPNNGYSDIYQIIVGLENIFFVSLGITVLYKLLLNYFSSQVSFMTVIITLFGTNLLFYSGVDVINSHPASFLTSVLFLFLWAKSRKRRTLIQWMILGSLLSFMTMVRTQDVLFVLLLLLDLVVQKESALKKIKNVFITGIVFIMVFIPQLFMWKYIFGNYFMSPYLKGGFNFFQPHIFEVLFNRQNGLFIWTPIYVLCFFGLFIFKKTSHLRFSFLAISLLQLYLITAWSGWYQGRAFSIRMIITGLPYLSFGLGTILAVLKKNIHQYLFNFLCIFLILYNLVSILIFLL